MRFSFSTDITCNRQKMASFLIYRPSNEQCFTVLKVFRHFPTIDINEPSYITGVKVNF